MKRSKEAGKTWREGFRDLAKKMAEDFTNVGDQLDAVLAKSFEFGKQQFAAFNTSFQEFDQGLVDLNRSLGLMFAGREEILAELPTEAYGQDLNDLGITINKQAENFAGLASNSQSFASIMQDPTARRNINMLGLIMEKAGVSAQSFGAPWTL